MLHFHFCVHFSFPLSFFLGWGVILLVPVVVQSLGKEQQWQQMICASGLSHIFLLCHDYDDDDDDHDDDDVCNWFEITITISVFT